MDIVSLPVVNDKDKVDSRFRLVVIAAQRARELAVGAKAKMGTRYKKAPLIALEEALENKLEFCVGAEARQKNDEARKFDYRRFLEERKRASRTEDISDLEKDLRVFLHDKESPAADKRSLEELFGEKKEEGEQKPKG